LEAKGYETLTATDGGTGIQLAAEHAVDVVVLDYQLPAIDGDEVTAILRNRDPNLPIILLAGSCESVPESVLRHVEACINKAESPTVLLSQLVQCIGSVSQRKSKRNPSL